jgi:hypothetical protein
LLGSWGDEKCNNQCKCGSRDFLGVGNDEKEAEKEGRDRGYERGLMYNFWGVISGWVFR